MIANGAGDDAAGGMPSETLGDFAVPLAAPTGAARRLERHGYVRIPAFAGHDTLAALVAAGDTALRCAPGLVSGFAARTHPPAEPRVLRESRTTRRLFGIHRLGDFSRFLATPTLVDLGRSLLGDDVDCFISAYCVRGPGDIGKSWHQFGFWYPAALEHTLAVWLSLSDVRDANGVLRVLPGSHRAGLVPHAPDTRVGAGIGWMCAELGSGSDPVDVRLAAGDLVAIHDSLLHAAGGNASPLPSREAVFCFVPSGVPIDAESVAPVLDRVPWLVAGRPQPA